MWMCMVVIGFERKEVKRTEEGTRVKRKASGNDHVKELQKGKIAKEKQAWVGGDTVYRRRNGNGNGTTEYI